MKFSLFILTTMLFYTNVFAQDSLNLLKPIAGDRVLSIGIINNSALESAKKYKTDKVACRFGLNGALSI
jgi:hypothetical protein